MSDKRLIEVFSAGCPACDPIVEMVRRLACPSCDISVLDMHDPQVAVRAKELGVSSVPAVAGNRDTDRPVKQAGAVPLPSPLAGAGVSRLGRAGEPGADRQAPHRHHDHGSADPDRSPSHK